VKQTAQLVLVLIAGIVIGAWRVPILKAQTAGHPAYVVAEVHVTDPAGFMNYAKQVPASLAPYHGKTLARALPDVREGAPPDGDMVIIAFDSLQDANRWYQSPEYSKLIPLRQQSATTRVLIVDGMPQ
jgi:uncharacterized protein (DUF1330 family)